MYNQRKISYISNCLAMKEKERSPSKLNKEICYVHEKYKYIYYGEICQAINKMYHIK